MKFSLFKGKSKRTIIFTLISLFSIVFLLAGNMVLTYFTPRESIYFDMTVEGLYSLSDEMKKETAFVDELGDGKKIKITFCTDPDELTSSTATRVTYFMALKLQERYRNIEVETVNAELNPTALAKYKPTSLSTIAATDVIVSYGDRYRISSATKFWMFDDSEYFSYNGEYHMVSMLKSVTAVDQPKAYFLTDHGETYYDPENPESAMSLSMQSFANLLAERGLDIKTLNLSESAGIPDDCVLLIINNPTIDFSTNSSQYDKLSYVSETEKLDRYLVKNQGAVMVAKDFRVDLPVLEKFLYGWGIEFGDSLLKDSEASLDDELDSETKLISSYSTDEESYSYAIYGDFASISSAPRTIFSDAGYVKCSYGEDITASENGASNITRNYISFLATSENAKPYAKNSLTGEYQDLAGYAGSYDLAALVARDCVDEYNNENKISFLFCVNTKDFFSNELIGNAYYANHDIVSSLIDNISRLDVFGSIDLGGPSGNSSSYGGKQLRDTALSTEDTFIYSSDATHIIETNYGIKSAFTVTLTIIVFSLPVAALVLGIVVAVKRRFL